MKRYAPLLLMCTAFLLSGCLSFGNLVWEDLNGNGIQDRGEPGVAGVTVNLMQDGAILESVQTDSQGIYDINWSRPSGAYDLQFIASSQYHFTLPNQGNNDSVDSDVYPGATTPNIGLIASLTASDNSEDMDAGLVDASFDPEAIVPRSQASIGDLVWFDANGNGQQDEGEPGVEGVLVTVFTNTGEYVDEMVTDAEGFYEFSGLTVGAEYQLQFEAPEHYWFTNHDVGDDSLDSDAERSDFSTSETVEGVLLGEGGTSDVDAGLEGSPSIGNYVWHDANQNGLQDEGESGVEGVRVTLNAPSVPASQTTTDANGFYEFNELLAGEQYSLKFDPPENYLLTMQDEGGDDSLDSDPDPESGQTTQFTLAEVGTRDMDAGVYVPGSGAASFCYGPGADPFPEGVSPLSGLPVSEPNYLGLNPVFTSISIFPPQVRPPSGLSTAPQVFQLYIGDGDSRLLVVNYGEFPTSAYNEEDDGEGSSAIPESQDEDQYVVAGRVWYDNTPNNLQDVEPGISDVPVRLVDINLNTVQTTTTVAGGYYWFVLDDVELNTEFQVRVGAPPSLNAYYFVEKDVGSDDTIDSDVTANGYTDFFDPTDDPASTTLFYDAGVRQAVFLQGFRSGRSAHQDIQGNYCGCLVAAGADPVVGEGLNTCGNAFSSDPNDIGGAGLDVTRLLTIAQNYTENSSCQPNLQDSSLFCTESPLGGMAGNELYMQYNINNISHFEYDDALGGYTWVLSTPKSEAVRGNAPFSVQTEEYTQMVDGLTDETLTFENVVVLMVEHTAQNAAVTIIDLEMDFQTGTAFVFRNGQVFEATWSSLYPDYVADTDNPLPVHLEVDGQPFALAPGQTFFNIVNEFDSMTEISTGVWLADFDAPAYSPQ